MSEQKKQRNTEILILLAIGLSGALVGEMYGLVKSRINQIKKDNDEEYTKLLTVRKEAIDKVINTYKDLCNIT